MTHELNIFTNDGWVVTLVSDKAIDLGDALVSTIIVQPKAAHDARVPVGPDPNVTRTEYRLYPAAPAAAPVAPATPAPELTDAQLHPRVMPKGEFEFDR